jgi:hypothetical protein
VFFSRSFLFSSYRIQFSSVLIRTFAIQEVLLIC